MLDLSVAGAVVLPAEMRRRLRTEVARMIRAAARHDGSADYEVSLRLVGDAEICALNRGYRAKDRPTDVLAFAQREGPSAQVHPALLGDLVISVDTARRQARHGLYRELLHLASHGLCHLLGYDHRDDAEEAEMNARAAALRAEACRRGRIRPA
ncbi:MAG TPA: rRNA maturation RNase YbeY [Kofleriaceae bacterium]